MQRERPALKAGALFIPVRQVARPSVGSCIVLIICVVLRDLGGALSCQRMLAFLFPLSQHKHFAMAKPNRV